jgi:hypothetical protein
LKLALLLLIDMKSVKRFEHFFIFNFNQVFGCFILNSIFGKSSKTLFQHFKRDKIQVIISRGIQFKQLKTEFKHAMLELSILNILTWLNTNYIFVYILRDVKHLL